MERVRISFIRFIHIDEQYLPAKPDYMYIKCINVHPMLALQICSLDNNLIIDGELISASYFDECTISSDTGERYIYLTETCERDYFNTLHEPCLIKAGWKPYPVVTFEQNERLILDLDEATAQFNLKKDSTDESE